MFGISGEKIATNKGGYINITTYYNVDTAIGKYRKKETINNINKKYDIYLFVVCHNFPKKSTEECYNEEQNERHVIFRIFKI